MQNFRFLCSAAVALLFVLASCAPESAQLATFSPDEITVGEPLAGRMEQNLERLQSSIYLPPTVYDDKDWPGDFVGRTILGLSMESRALHKQVPLLDELISGLDERMNPKGYMGPVYAPVLNEQALSGHGWLLRGLSECYDATGDPSIKASVGRIADSLFVPGKELYPTYPITSDVRSNIGGEASGTIAGSIGSWMLSTDIGCVFIGMAGLVDAYGVVGGDELKSVIDLLVARFLEVDLAGIQAQTHATLSALRGLLKYASLTSDASLVDEVVKRWNLYVGEGMTCTYANYNWFGRPDSWTEPCAIVDSYMVAFELWRLTQDPSYRNMAELIFTNGICRAQRANGGFGCENCPVSPDQNLSVFIPEAHWCCTMRGAEGLSRAAQYRWAVKGSSLYVPFYGNGSLSAKGLEVSQTTAYPSDGKVAFTFTDNSKGIACLLVPDLPWAENQAVMVNGEQFIPEPSNGFLCIYKKFKKGDTVEITFDMPLRSDEWNGYARYFKGPVMMGLPAADSAAAAEDLAALEAGLVPVPNMMEPVTPVLQVLFSK